MALRLRLRDGELKLERIKLPELNLPVEEDLDFPTNNNSKIKIKGIGGKRK